MQLSFLQKSSTELYVDPLKNDIEQLPGKRCKISIWSILGVEVENQLLGEKKLIDVTKGLINGITHLSETDPFVHIDASCRFKQGPSYRDALLEMKSTFEKVHNRAKRHYYDTFLMGEMQHQAIEDAIEADGTRMMLMSQFYFPTNKLVLVDMRGRELISEDWQWSVIQGKIKYGIPESAVIAEYEKVFDKQFLWGIRKLQWDAIRNHSKNCSKDVCTVGRHKPKL